MYDNSPKTENINNYNSPESPIVLTNKNKCISTLYPINKISNEIFNKFLAATIVFIIPLVINLVIGLFGEISSFSSCWENADSFSFGSSTYQKTDEDKDKKKTSIINDRSGYEDSINPGNSCLKENGTTRVLFVGNSKTYEGEIPSKFKGISEANGYNVSVSSVTKGGKTLEWLASNYRSQITNDSYDCVILQEQTDVYGGDYNTYLKGVRNVVSLVRRQNNNVKTYIRALWITRESSSSDSKTSYENTETIAKKTSSFVIYVNAILPFSKNSSLSEAIRCNSKFAFVFTCNTFLYTRQTFTPLFSSQATNSNVSAVTPEYLNPPVSVIIPANIQVPISFVISILK